MIKISEYKKAQEIYVEQEINKMEAMIEDDIDNQIIENTINHTNIFSRDGDDIRFYGCVYDFKNPHDRDLLFEAANIIKIKYEENGWEFVNIFGSGGRCIGVKIS